MTKNWRKKYSWTFFLLFWLKIANYLSLGLKKDVKATGEAFSPQRRTSSTSKNEIINFFSFLWVLFCPPGSRVTTLKKRKLKEPKCEISDILDFRYFYTTNPSIVSRPGVSLPKKPTQKGFDGVKNRTTKISHLNTFTCFSWAVLCFQLRSAFLSSSNCVLIMWLNIGLSRTKQFWKCLNKIWTVR